MPDKFYWIGDIEVVAEIRAVFVANGYGQTEEEAKKHALDETRDDVTKYPASTLFQHVKDYSANVKSVKALSGETEAV